MATAVVNQPSGSDTQTGNQPAAPPGWVAGLPADLKTNETFTKFQTVGDLGRSYLDLTARVAKVPELETRLANSIPKLGDNATQEERDRYQTALGRPQKPEEYEFEGDGKNDPKWAADWKQDLFKLGLPKDTAKSLSHLLSTKIQAMVDAHNANIQRMNVESETKLKAEWGDKYDANTELAKRFWKEHGDGEFDKAFEGATGAQRHAIAKFVFRMAAKTGEDRSQPGAQARTARPNGGMTYPNSPAPPNAR